MNLIMSQYWTTLEKLKKIALKKKTGWLFDKMIKWMLFLILKVEMTAFSEDGISEQTARNLHSQVKGRLNNHVIRVTVQPFPLQLFRMNLGVRGVILHDCSSSFHRET